MRYLLFVWLGVSATFVLHAGDVTAAHSPVQQRIAAAEARIRAQPKSEQGYNDLAFAYCRLARDRNDVQLYDKADQAVQTSLKVSPGNFEAKKLHVLVLLGKGQAAEALKAASDLQTHNHDDINLWGFLVDANLALNKLDDAERDAQWILDLRAGSSLGFTKAARIRELTGDPEGAIEFYEEAARRTAQGDPDERSWLMIQNARCQLKLSHNERAEALAKQALSVFPDSQLAQDFLSALPASKQPVAGTR